MIRGSLNFKQRRYLAFNTWVPLEGARGEGGAEDLLSFDCLMNEGGVQAHGIRGERKEEEMKTVFRLIDTCLMCRHGVLQRKEKRLGITRLLCWPDWSERGRGNPSG